MTQAHSPGSPDDHGIGNSPAAPPAAGHLLTLAVIVFLTGSLFTAQFQAMA